MTKQPQLNRHEVVNDTVGALIVTCRDGSRHRGLYDLVDHDLVSNHRWYLSGGYFIRSQGGRDDRETIYLHRAILGLRRGDPRRGDHIFGNRRDNRRSKLRIVDDRINNHNRAVINERGTSRYRGVAWDKERGLWMAYVRIDRRNRNVGRFASEDEAAEAIAKFRREQGLPAGY